jgi:hypothetical protein
MYVCTYVCACVCLCVWVCVACACLQGDVPRAGESAGLALAATPTSAEARRLAVCVCLVRGDHAAAAALLKGASPAGVAPSAAAAPGPVAPPLAGGRPGVRGK